MPNLNPPNIPPEILESERKRAEMPTPRPDIPGPLGLPSLPAEGVNAILDLVVRYLPYLVLAVSAFNGFGAVSLLITMSNNPQMTISRLAGLGAFLNLASAIFGVLAYVWLTQRRRLGWNLLVLVLVLMLTGQLLMSGFASILYAGIEVGISIYVMLKIRDVYNK